MDMPLSSSPLVHLGAEIGMLGAVKKRKSKHPWYAKKGYLHFDYALDIREASRYVSNPSNIAQHKFSPFIHYIKISRKVKRDKMAEAAWKAAGKPENSKPKLITKDKPRNIFYASHIDGYIYSYYSSKIQNAYDKYLRENSLEHNVIAYRSVKRGKTKYSNIHFARDAFAFLGAHADLNVSCYDLSKFFDRLDTDILLKNWAKIWGVSALPDDHKALHKQLSNFTFVEEEDLIENFRNNFSESPRRHGFDPLSGGSSNHRICSYAELRQLHKDFKSRGKKLIQPKGHLDITGIAQGSAISGLLANIFMTEFDLAVKRLIEDMGGLYMRYSDDLFIAYPVTCSHAHMDETVRNLLRDTCGTSVTVNSDKTENSVVRKIDGKLHVYMGDGVTPGRIQYLGFHLSSHGIHIRNSSISKDRGKTVQAVANAHRRKSHGKIDTQSVYKTKSHRKVTNWNPDTEKGFVNYANRSAEIFDNPETLNKQIRKSDRFVRRAVVRRRERIAREQNS